jgi:hypothetical protein
MAQIEQLQEEVNASSLQGQTRDLFLNAEEGSSHSEQSGDSEPEVEEPANHFVTGRASVTGAAPPVSSRDGRTVDIARVSGLILQV